MELQKGKNRISVAMRWIIVAVVFVMAAALLLFSSLQSNQSVPISKPDIQFVGEYQIGGGQWQALIPGEHIPATKGDVNLRGNFYMYLPNGELYEKAAPGIPIAFFMNHISITVCEPGFQPYTMDCENPLFREYACGKMWIGYELRNNEEPITICIKNHHSFGNDGAVDALIENLAIRNGSDFESEMIAADSYQRFAGYIVIVLSLILLGVAIIATALRIWWRRLIWMIGGTMVFFGTYLLYSVDSIMFSSESIITNTNLQGISMMLYMFFLCGAICYLLDGKRFSFGIGAWLVQGIGCGIYFVLPLVTELFFYDTWAVWAVQQTVTNGILIGCLIWQIVGGNRKQVLLRVAGMLPLAVFGIDVLACKMNWWEAGLLSSIVFALLVAVGLVLVCIVIPKSLNSEARARQMEQEKNALQLQLQESRIAIMLSQIQPHFIYNMLNTIYHLCDQDGKKAQLAVDLFSRYLRNNIDSIGETKLVPFSTELEHIGNYVALEKIRFADELEIDYRITTDKFLLPVLTIQPLVENAIKHGVSKKRGGGTVWLRTAEAETCWVITVEDNGVGFEPERYQEDGKQHIGIENVRQRLQNTCFGRLEITSAPGQGTVATVYIPKEAGRQ